MAEKDYSSLIPQQPPKGIYSWLLSNGYLKEELLIFKAEWCMNPETGKKEQLVRISCSDCNQSMYVEKVSEADCNGITSGASGYPAPFGFWHPESEEPVTSGSLTSCPFCMGTVRAVHVSNIPKLGYKNYVYPTTITRMEDKLVVQGWAIEKLIDKQAHTSFYAHPYEAYVLEKKRLVRLTGYVKCMFSISWKDKWEQKKRFQDNWGKCDLLYPWDTQLLEGSTAAHSKLDIYMYAMGKNANPVSYLHAWRKYPEIENLVMQGASRFVNSLMGYDVKDDNYAYTRFDQKLDTLAWKERSPAKMLGMTKPEFQMLVQEDWEWKDWDFWTEKRKDGLRLSAVQMRKANTLGYDRCRSLEKKGINWEKTADYLEKQKKKDERVDHLILLDYWSMQKKLGRALSTQYLMFPPDLVKAHNKVMKEGGAYDKLEKLQDIKEREALFQERFEILSRFSWEQDGLFIRPAQSEHELIDESEQLNHCVQNYASACANGAKNIFFIRKVEAPEKSYFTLQLNEKSLTVVQNRGKGNCARTPEVQKFETEWLVWCKTQEVKRKPKKKQQSKKSSAA